MICDNKKIEKKELSFFIDLLAAWFTGEKTKNEIIDLTTEYLNLAKYTVDYGFDYALELALREYDESYRNGISFYMVEGIKLVTIEGLLHHFEELKSHKITLDDFLDWASWCNIGCENTSGDFENLNIEYFCLIFILKYSDALDTPETIDMFTEIIKQSSRLSYGQFVVLLYLQIEKERRSFYYFFKSYLDDEKSMNDVKKYVHSKYNHILKYFNYDFETFPYFGLLSDIRENNGTVEEFIQVIENDIGINK